MSEEEMEMEVELMLEVREVDPDYEFDAPMFFDFACVESLPEARVAESWFLTAPCYPPSPFVAKMVSTEENSINDRGCGHGDQAGPTVSGTEVVDREDGKGMHKTILSNLQGNDTQVPSQLLGVATDQSIFNHLPTETKVRSTIIKPKAWRSSTLMKPTASILAKQNRPPVRYLNPLFQQEKTISNSIGVECQASKRQKVEGGHFFKVGEAKPQTDFLHKAPKRDVNCDKASVPAKLRVTIPREPDLGTANRAERIRPKTAWESDHVEVAERGFKARPLNRKILEAPLLAPHKRSTPKFPQFQEFHLKTSERAMHQHSANSSSVAQQSTFGKDFGKLGILSATEIGMRESKRPNMVEASRQDGCGSTFAFKARPFNKKIFSSKGDIGVFRNAKREVTVPREFRFQTDKRAQHNPPVELFSKLCLTPKVHPNNGSQMPLPWSSSVSIKGSKENRLHPFLTEHKMTSPAKDVPPMYGMKQNPCGNDGCLKEVANHIHLRSSGIS